MKNIDGGRQIGKNIVLSILAQGISLLVSVLINLVVPKVIDEYQYAYWQTYVLYIGYVGILHFGLLDGILLRYSQYNYEALDKAKMRSQFGVLLLIVSSFSFVLMIVATIVNDVAYRMVLVAVAIGTISKNLVTYTSYSFQMTNRINNYVTIIIMQRVSFGLLSLILLLLRVREFYLFCIADLCGDLVAFALGWYHNRGMYLGKMIQIRETIREGRKNLTAGMRVLLANWAAMFVIDGVKMIVQWRWGQLLFGKVSFAFSLANLFVAFISAAGVVLFPTIKRTSEQDLALLYCKMRNIVVSMLFASLVLYFPLCSVMEEWLPAYQKSLSYLGLLLPMVIYTAKSNLLTNNYLKVCRKEKDLLIINAIAVMLCLGVSVVCAYVLNWLNGILLAVVISLMIRAMAAEIIISRIFRIKLKADFVAEGIITAGFLLLSIYTDRVAGCVAYFILIIPYFWWKYINVREMHKQKHAGP